MDWEAESYPEYQDLIYILFFALFFPILRLILDRLVFEALAKRMICGKDAKVIKGIKRKKINKFKESAWKFTYFLSAEIFALCITYNEPWFTNTRHYWAGPRDQVWPDLKIKLKLKGWHMYAGGFYLYSIFALLYWETRRSDFAAHMIHHITSLSLFLLSYIFRIARGGSVVGIIHDGSDVLMEFAKMSTYSGFHTIADISFGFFALSWLLLRLIYFPFWVIRSTCYEVLFIVDKEKHHNINGIILYIVVNSMLICLLVLHIFWWTLICRMIINKLKKGHVDDVRSDSESDEDEHKQS
ncbi:alternaria stem canker resistance protein 1-like [Lycium barbarum]|uniref:alternaria stem canker resistance protein 1-like n=1 Tax=Lycium barbarum TaxID=112863 RepID=UPI00293EAFA3|nr:alternaria stem canker resistance protein 1-like [Lycium barbarum]